MLLPGVSETSREDPAAGRRGGAPDRRGRPPRGARRCCASTARSSTTWSTALLKHETLDEADAYAAGGTQPGPAQRPTWPAAARRHAHRVDSAGRAALVAEVRHPRECLVALDDALLDQIRVGPVVHQVPGAVGDLTRGLGRRELPQPVDESSVRTARSASPGRRAASSAAARRWSRATCRWRPADGCAVGSGPSEACNGARAGCRSCAALPLSAALAEQRPKLPACCSSPGM